MPIMREAMFLLLDSYPVTVDEIYTSEPDCHLRSSYVPSNKIVPKHEKVKITNVPSPYISEGTH